MIRMRYFILSFFLLSVFPYSAAFAQEQEEEEDSFSQPIQEFPFAEAVYLQEKHEVQATLSYYHNYERARIGNVLNFEVEYGFTDWFQVSAEITRDHKHNNRLSFSVDQFEVASMISLYNTPRQAVSLEMGVEFPLTSPAIEGENLEGSETSYTPMLIYGLQAGAFQFHLNAGVELEKDEHTWFYNAAAVYGKSRLHPILELNGIREEEMSWYLAPGFVLNTKNGWELVTGIRKGITEPTWGLAIRLLYEFTAGKQ
ncbi:hypothetical protein ACSX1A_05580 [Pontibacter sp. MBLB2868]|uniref:hypothetical protein n=1 Tax=Pontibacter sp. MBLB2868 TaxID=3451555 RepID=UPI003F752E65